MEKVIIFPTYSCGDDWRGTTFFFIQKDLQKIS